MPFASSNSETVVVRSPVVRDVFGDVVAGAVTDVSVPECLVAPGSSSEDSLHSAQVVADAEVYMPTGYTVTAAHRLIIRGEEYEVLGKPQLWLNEGLVVSVRQVVG